MPDGVFSTVVELAKTGFIGVGVIVFLLLFILLMRGKPVDTASAKLYNRLLTWGVSFAMFSGALSIATLMLQPKPAAVPSKLTMTFAPDFDTEKLPTPRIKLSDGRMVAPDREFDWPGGMINVSVGDALNQVRALKSTVDQYGQTITTLRDQRDKLAKSVADSSPATSDAGVAEASKTSAQLQSEVRTAIDTGDFARAAIASKTLNAPRIAAPRAITEMVRDR